MQLSSCECKSSIGSKLWKSNQRFYHFQILSYLLIYEFHYVIKEFKSNVLHHWRIISKKKGIFFITELQIQFFDFPLWIIFIYLLLLIFSYLNLKSLIHQSKKWCVCVVAFLPHSLLQLSPHLTRGISSPWWSERGQKRPLNSRESV